MKVLSVAQAAEELGVSPRRVLQLLAAGHLRGEQLGWGWALDQSDVDRLRNHRGVAGRPWSPASAWAVLALANGDQPHGSPVERSRARQRLAQHGLAGLVDRLRARAEAQRFYAHPAVLERLILAKGVVRGGVSAASEHDAGLIAHDLVEAYVARRRLPAMADRYALDPDGERPNVLLHVVEDVVWRFADDASVASWPVVAVDLIEADDERSQRAGRELIERRS